ncbi:MAG: hemolysin family protein [Christensenellales bacterium]
MSSDIVPLHIILQIGFIFINAFFTACVVALRFSSASKLISSAEDGDRKAARVLPFFEYPHRIKNALYLAFLFCALLAAVFCTLYLAPALDQWLFGGVLGSWAIVLLILLLSLCHLTFSIILPTRVVTRHPEDTLMRLYRLMNLFSWITRPFSALGYGCVSGIMRLFRIQPDPTREDVTEEEIRFMANLGEENGSIETEERHMIDNIFEFSNKTASDVMTHRTDVFSIAVDASVQEVQDMIIQSGHSRFPVYGRSIDDILGILYLRDYFVNQHSTAPVSIEELLRPAYFVPESVSADALFSDLRQKKVHIAIVVDEYGGTNGIVTMEDLIEEIVGNIYDEYDPAEEPIEQQSDNCWRIHQTAPLHEVSDALGVDLPEDGYESFGSLVFSSLDSTPTDGTRPVFELFGLHIEAECVEDRHIEWMLVSKLQSDETTSGIQPEMIVL